MKRRQFVAIVLSTFVLRDLKAANKVSIKEVKGIQRFNPFKLKELTINDSEISSITINGNMKITLPENPEPIKSFIKFTVLKTRWSKSPVIASKNEKIMAADDEIIVRQVVDLDKNNTFILQYLGEELGWNLFV